MSLAKTLDPAALCLTEGGDAAIRAAYQPRRPEFEFGAKPAPPPPDYWDPATWAALPFVKDAADFVPANSKLAEAQDTAAADVFFIHPTGYSSAASWNAPWDDKQAAQAAEAMMVCCASAFNAAARVYAPRYRQMTIYGVLELGPSGIRALDLAYSDVERAFEHYMTFYNQGRPFILAGHSQGSMHGLRLLQEKIIGTPHGKAPGGRLSHRRAGAPGHQGHQALAGPGPDRGAHRLQRLRRRRGHQLFHQAGAHLAGRQLPKDRGPSPGAGQSPVLARRRRTGAGLGQPRFPARAKGPRRPFPS